MWHSRPDPRCAARCPHATRDRESPPYSAAHDIHAVPCFVLPTSLYIDALTFVILRLVALISALKCADCLPFVVIARFVSCFAMLCIKIAIKHSTDQSSATFQRIDTYSIMSHDICMKETGAEWKSECTESALGSDHLRVRLTLQTRPTGTRSRCSLVGQ